MVNIFTISLDIFHYLNILILFKNYMAKLFMLNS